MKPTLCPLDTDCYAPLPGYQPRTNTTVINETFFKKFAAVGSHATLLEAFPFGSKIYFSHPLQRRAESTGDSSSRFWWETSGGYNARLACGIVVGVRSLSAGETTSDSGYTPKTSWPVLVVQFHPYRAPRFVLPWTVWKSKKSYKLSASIS